MSAVGNSIDAGVSLEVNIKGNIKKSRNKGFSHSDYYLFREKLKNSKDILLLIMQVKLSLISY